MELYQNKIVTYDVYIFLAQDTLICYNKQVKSISYLRQHRTITGF